MLKLKFEKSKAIAVAVVLLSANILYFAQPASAAVLTNTTIRLNRMAQAQTTTFRIIFKAATAGATTATIDFNGADSTTWSGTSGSVHAGVMTTSTAACVTDGYTALAGALTVTGSVGHTITLTGITAINNTSTYCLDFTNADAVTTATAGEYHPTVVVGSDSQTIAVRTLGVNLDQIVVSATVPPTFNLALSGFTDTFPASLSAGGIGVTTGRTVTINTNAKNGWFAWASGVNTGLASVATSTTIPATTPGTNATLVAGTPGNVFGITSITQGSGAGTTAATAAYTSNGTTTGSGLDTTIRQIASSNGTANGAVLTVKELAAISPVTPAATDYTDTITIIGAGNF
jgi:hypothetical protein